MFFRQLIQGFACKNVSVSRLVRGRSAQSGYGIALLLVFLFSTIMIGTSLQMVGRSTAGNMLGKTFMDNVSAQQIALVGYNAAVADIQSSLDAGTTVDTSYQYPAGGGTNNVSVADDPTNLAGSSTVIGTYRVTLSQARGNAYMVKVAATVGGSTYNYYRLLQMTALTTPFTSCSAVEADILAGNIASISDANLQAYAQNDCMIKTPSLAPYTITAPSTNDGSTTPNTCSSGYTGSGTFRSDRLYDEEVQCVKGTYSAVYLYSTSAMGYGTWFLSNPTSGSRTVHIPGSVYGNCGHYGTVVAAMSGSTSGGGYWPSSTAYSSVPHTFLFNGVSGTGTDIWVSGGSGDDTISFNGSASIATLDGAAGNNKIIISGTYGSSSENNTLTPGTGSGNNIVYIGTLGGSGYQDYIAGSGGTGTLEVFFNNTSGTNSKYIYGGSNDDIIGCGISFSGGTGACGTLSSGFTIRGYGGEDIISIDALTPTSTNIYGYNGSTTEATANIIYTKGCSGSSNINLQSSTGGLVISAGNRASGCTITGAGNSVILLKTGTTSSGTITGFARTLTY